MSHAALLSVDLDAAAEKPLFRQLYDDLSQSIRTGRIKPGAQLPPSRSFAKEIGVSRATIIAAYDQLIAEGYAVSRVGSGVFASDIGPFAQEWLTHTPPRRAEAPKPGRIRPFSHISPDMRAFPHALWAQYVGRVARTEASGLSDLPDPFGDWPLRAAIAAHLRDWRGVSAAPDQVLITAGSGDALELILQAIAPPNACIGLENPGYRILAQVCQRLGYRPHWLAVDAQGARLPGQDVVLSVITPSCQFPLGGTMPIARRQAHLAMGKWLVEDDFDSEFRYAGQPVPALMSLDQGQKVIYLGSFSKVFSSSLRIGYLVLPEPLIAPMHGVLRQRGGRASALPQRVLARFMEDGAFHRHIRKMRRLYRGRRAAFLAGIDAHFGGVLSYQDHGAGMSVALRYARPLDPQKVQRNLTKAGLSCAPLEGYYSDGDPVYGLHCGFCAFDEAEISRGLHQMQSALARLF